MGGGLIGRYGKIICCNILYTLSWSRKAQAGLAFSGYRNLREGVICLHMCACSDIFLVLNILFSREVCAADYLKVKTIYTTLRWMKIYLLAALCHDFYHYTSLLRVMFAKFPTGIVNPTAVSLQTAVWADTLEEVKGLDQSHHCRAMVPWIAMADRVSFCFPLRCCRRFGARWHSLDRHREGWGVQPAPSVSWSLSCGRAGTADLMCQGGCQGGGGDIEMPSCSRWSC